MSSYNKTERLGLNNWSESDRPMRNDFNSDNLIIDEVLGNHISDSDMHLGTEEKSRVSRPLVINAYTGNGNSERTITLSKAPLGVFVYRVDKPFSVYDSATGCTKVYSSVAFVGGQSATGLSLNGSTVTVRQSSASVGGVLNCLNEADAQYKIISIV